MGNKVFSVSLAKNLGELCKQAYRQYDAYSEDKEWSLPDGYAFLTTLHGVYESNSIPVGFIAKKEQDLFIAWRGTDNVEEWIIDIKFEQVNCPYFDKSIKLEPGLQ